MSDGERKEKNQIEGPNWITKEKGMQQKKTWGQLEGKFPENASIREGSEWLSKSSARGKGSSTGSIFDAKQEQENLLILSAV